MAPPITWFSLFVTGYSIAAIGPKAWRAKKHGRPLPDPCLLTSQDLTQAGAGGAGGAGDVECFFHYTTELGFYNITNESKELVEVFVFFSEFNVITMC